MKAKSKKQSELELWRSVAPKDKVWCDVIAPWFAPRCEDETKATIRGLYKHEWLRLRRRSEFAALPPKEQLKRFIEEVAP